MGPVGLTDTENKLIFMGRRGNIGVGEWEVQTIGRKMIGSRMY